MAAIVGYYDPQFAGTSGSATASVTIPTGATSCLVQPQLFSTNAAKVLVNIDAAATKAANLGKLGDGDTLMLFGLKGKSTVQVRFTTAAGADQNAGADDKVLLRFSTGEQVP